MLKFHFLGTCSGTEPKQNRHHSSIVLETNGLYYWFDAGENCSHKAYTSGIDVTRVRAVFISHMHIDHTGGLANLIFTIYKIATITKTPHINNNSYDVFVPDIEKFRAAHTLADAYRPASYTKVDIIEHEVHDGLIFEDENIKVSAIHNTHLRENGENGWHAYSYLIEADGKRVVFSGDVGCPEELDCFMQDAPDLFIMETGHHAVARVCDYAKEKKAKKLLFTHHGREILNDFDAAEKFVASQDIDAHICNDGDVIVV